MATKDVRTVAPDEPERGASRSVCTVERRTPVADTDRTVSVETRSKMLAVSEDKKTILLRWGEAAGWHPVNVHTGRVGESTWYVSDADMLAAGFRPSMPRRRVYPWRPRARAGDERQMDLFGTGDE